MTDETPYTLDDTICAISTPPGAGGIAVARISGPEAITITDRVWRGKSLSQCTSHTAHLGTIIDADGQDLDQAVATIFRAPRSYTGQDTVEISVHGSKYIQQQLLKTLTATGCRLAGPGEFTRRAFATGRIDLAQAEAVADLIASTSRAAHRIAINQMRGAFSDRLQHLHSQLIDLTSLLELELDFSEEDVEFASRQRLRQIAGDIYSEISRLYKSFDTGAAIKEGIPVAIVGATNAGKSSLLNALVGDDKAIVSDIHGTTRDIVEDTMPLGDYTFRFMDTAGIRSTTDQIENIGIERSLQAATRARIIMLVIDATRPISDTLADIDARLWHQLPEDATIIVALNKCDLNTIVTAADINKLAASLPHQPHSICIISTSATTGQGITELTDQLIQSAVGDDTTTADVLVTNARHANALALAQDSIDRAIQGIDANLSGDFIAQDIRETLHHLATITGEITTTDILQAIFKNHCIGK